MTFATTVRADWLSTSVPSPATSTQAEIGCQQLLQLSERKAEVIKHTLAGQETKSECMDVGLEGPAGPQSAAADKIINVTTKPRLEENKLNIFDKEFVSRLFKTTLTT